MKTPKAPRFVRASRRTVPLCDHRALAQLRYEIRKFLHFSEDAAREAGIEPAQHQLLLAVKGLPEGLRPTIATIAERLCVQHHTAVALVDRLELRALVARERGERDRREVLVRLTRKGGDLLEKLSALHREQLGTAAPRMVDALRAILEPPPVKAPRAPQVKKKPPSRTRPESDAEAHP